MLKKLPDFVPAGLVKDLRQSLSSPVYLILYGIAMLLIWILYMGMEITAVFGLQIPLFLLLIPLRASMTVASDTHPRGNNFMQLTALSSREIVWGVMLSSLLQLLITACFIALIVALLSMDPNPRTAAKIGMYWKGLAGCTIGGALMTGLLMLAARVSLLFRMGAAFILMMGACAMFCSIMEEESWWIWPMLLGNALISLFLLVEFARRCYSSPSENTTRAARLFMLTPLAFYIVLQLTGVEPNAAVTQLLFGCWIAFIGATLDIALPITFPPQQKEAAVRWLPHALQMPGVPQASLFLFLVAALAAACLSWGGTELFQVRITSITDNTVPNEVPAEMLSCWQLLVSVGIPVKWLFSVLVTALVLDIVRKRSNPNRLLYFGIVAVSLLLLGIIVNSYVGIVCMWPYSCLLDVPSSFLSLKKFETSLNMLTLTNLVSFLGSVLILFVVFKKR